MSLAMAFESESVRSDKSRRPGGSESRPSVGEARRQRRAGGMSGDEVRKEQVYTDMAVIDVSFAG